MDEQTGIRFHNIKTFAAFVIFALTSSGCTLIAGTDEAPSVSLSSLRISYVETLRNAESLRAESFKETHFMPGPDALQRPTSVAADDFRVYVTDRFAEPSAASAARLFVFDRTNQTVSIVRSGPSIASSMNEKFVDPAAIAVDDAGMIYIADGQQGLVFKLDRNAALVMTIGRLGELSSPSALAIDNKRQRIYIADKHAGAVRAYSMISGHLLFEIGAERELKQPVGIAVDRNGYCLVLDKHKNLVFRFDSDGKQFGKFSLMAGKNNNKLQPTGIALDSAGHIYITDTWSNSILIFERDGTYLQSLGRTGTGRDEFWSPAGIFIDNRDTIYIADQMNSRIQVYHYER